MQRIKIELPEQFSFSTQIPVRITDINYGNHVGNDTVLTIIHEARMQFLMHHGYTELNLGGVGIIMSDVGIQYKAELLYGDVVIASVAAGAISKIAFDLYYKLEKQTGGKTILVATAKTGMVCYDYAKGKTVPVPAGVVRELTLPN
jgi:acyl-CoA thioester hydrolase